MTSTGNITMAEPGRGTSLRAGGARVVTTPIVFTLCRQHRSRLQPDHDNGRDCRHGSQAA